MTQQKKPLQYTKTLCNYSANEKKWNADDADTYDKQRLNKSY